jgi:hypothetical protein
VNDVVLLSCSVFAGEVEALRERRWPSVAHRSQTSRLHMHPARLGEGTADAVGAELAAGRRVVLVYGDCCGAMGAIERRPGVARTQALNCPDLVLGRERYRQLSHAGAFFVFPEWARTWPEMFRTETGLGDADTRDLMREMHTKLLYLDTGIHPVPHDALRRCADAAGLPIEVLDVGLDQLAASIEDALLRLGAVP